MDVPLVSVIVANVNGRGYLATLLESLDAQDYPADRRELIVVDNGSMDGSADFLRARRPDVRVSSIRETRGLPGRTTRARGWRAGSTSRC